ncbi:MAG: ShlB/FhaC/HecB family hemolysin secretion/activation protein [Neisseria sp.]|nr:ShlB/FhaC/HecB family hemolysin secretion/activation protein [Neisseria sp.]
MRNNLSLLRKQSAFQLLAASLLACTSAHVGADDGNLEIIRSQQRQQQLERQLNPAVDVRLEQPLPAAKALLRHDSETPCVTINEIALAADAPPRFSLLLPRLVRQSGFRPGMCLGSEGLQQLQTLAQNITISQGLITSQVYIAPQDLNSGRLALSVAPGKIGAIRYEENQGDSASVGRIGAFANKFPAKSGDVLNIRDIEQGLENLRRLPSVEADIRIEPAAEEGRSDIVVDWQQSRPIRFNIGIDDSGSKTTGKYQGSLAVSLDNPLGLSDLFYLSYSHDLGHKAAYTDSDGFTTGSGTRGFGLHYSVPVGKWLLALNHNTYRYHEATEGYNINYDYNGKSENSHISASRVIYRDARHKTTATAKLWRRQIRQYLDHTEIGVQHRRTAGWALDLHHRAYLGNAVLQAGLGYKRGTGAQGSLKAPEEYNDENDTIPGTSRMKILSAHLGVATPFHIGKQAFSFDSDWRAQWNHTPLVPNDKLAIGGRYTVRGFDGESSLRGERGWYLQNNLNWHYRPAHQIYLGLDIGRVSGRSTEGLPLQQLSGAVIGIKGAQKLGGIIGYDLFAGKPLHQPARFQTASPVYGFSLNYSF